MQDILGKERNKRAGYQERRTATDFQKQRLRGAHGDNEAAPADYKQPAATNILPVQFLYKVRQGFLGGQIRQAGKGWKPVLARSLRKRSCNRWSAGLW